MTIFLQVNIRQDFVFALIGLDESSLELFCELMLPLCDFPHSLDGEQLARMHKKGKWDGLPLSGHQQMN